MPKKQKTTALEKLDKAWKKASPLERAAFLEGLERPDLMSAAIGSQAPASRIADGRYLLPDTVKRITKVMRQRGLSPDMVMQEIGFGMNGRPLLRALAKGSSLRLSIISALADWLKETDPD